MRRLKRFRIEIAGTAIVVVVAAYVLNERWHTDLDDRGYRWPDGRAACFARTEVVSGKSDALCSDSMAICERAREESTRDADYKSIGRCRVVSSRWQDREAYDRDVILAWVVAGLVALVVFWRRMGRGGGGGNAADEAWRRKLKKL